MRSHNWERRGRKHGDDTGNILSDDTGEFLSDDASAFLGDDTGNILWELGCLVCDLSFIKINFHLNYSSQDMKKLLCTKFSRK